MLTADRPALAKRAVECFRAQTYEDKCLLIWDTSQGHCFTRGMDLPINERCIEGARGYTIGQLRNQAADWLGQLADPVPDIICHFDDDDHSNANRIAEQVALLETTGAEVVGYNEMLFWREAVPAADDFYIEDAPDDCSGDFADGGEPGEAWLYRGTILGTSLMYRRELWQRFPFPATSYGEDTDFLKLCQHNKVNITGVSSVHAVTYVTESGQPGTVGGFEPRMIARIHDGNTSKAYAPEAMRAATHHWSRVPEWDAYCREVME